MSLQVHYKHLLMFDTEEQSEGDKSGSEEELVPVEKGQKRRDLGRTNNKKFVASVHKKKNQICSNKQALLEVAKPMQNMAQSQVKRMKMTLDAEEKKEERRMKDR